MTDTTPDRPGAGGAASEDLIGRLADDLAALRAREAALRALDNRDAVDTRPEPDEPGEGTLTRQAPGGGLEVRLLSDRDDRSLAEQMDRVTDRAEGDRPRGVGHVQPGP